MSLITEFKKFALKGSMVDLAIGVIVGSAFNSLVNAIVNDFFTPILGWITGGINFSNMFWQLSGEQQHSLSAAQNAGATIAYGHFLTQLINFLIVAWVLFLFVKALNKFRDRHDLQADAAPKISGEEKLLKEIRDLLAEKKQR